MTNSFAFWYSVVSFAIQTYSIDGRKQGSIVLVFTTFGRKSTVLIMYASSSELILCITGHLIPSFARLCSILELV